jgi:hypothetical protein
MTDVDRILYRTVDPTVVFRGKPLPAATTLLIRICDNDPDKFEEATRVVELFISEALTFGRLIQAPTPPVQPPQEP